MTIIGAIVFFILFHQLLVPFFAKQKSSNISLILCFGKKFLTKDFSLFILFIIWQLKMKNS